MCIKNITYAQRSKGFMMIIRFKMTQMFRRFKENAKKDHELDFN